MKPLKLYTKQDLIVVRDKLMQENKRLQDEVAYYKQLLTSEKIELAEYSKYWRVKFEGVEKLWNRVKQPNHEALRDIASVIDDLTWTIVETSCEDTRRHSEALKAKLEKALKLLEEPANV